jgi:hypothetical protein
MASTADLPATEPILPSWFKQRQCKAEKVAGDGYRLTAPNLAESFIAILPGGNNCWSAVLRAKQDGPALAATLAEHETPTDAWAAAFELYRTHLVV